MGNIKHSEMIKQGLYKNLRVNRCEKLKTMRRIQASPCGCVKAAVYPLSLVERRKRMCNLSSYLCIWRSARQRCHDLFYSELGARISASLPNRMLNDLAAVYVSLYGSQYPATTSHTEEKKQSLGPKTHLSHM